MTTLEHHFLIAMPSLEDPNFHKSIIYLYEHNEEGALGLIINKPMQVMIGDVLRHLNMSIKNAVVEQMPVLLGGPIAQEQGFIVAPKSDLHITDKPLLENDEIVISTSKILLQALAQGEGPQELLVTLGYCGWAAGQLENEILRNAWLLAPYNKEVFFHTPFEQRWRSGIASLGIDITKLTSDSGHA